MEVKATAVTGRLLKQGRLPARSSASAVALVPSLSPCSGGRSVRNSQVPDCALPRLKATVSKCFQVGACIEEAISRDGDGELIAVYHLRAEMVCFVVVAAFRKKKSQKSNKLSFFLTPCPFKDSCLALLHLSPAISFPLWCIAVKKKQNVLMISVGASLTHAAINTSPRAVAISRRTNSIKLLCQPSSFSRQPRGRRGRDER